MTKRQPKGKNRERLAHELASTLLKKRGAEWLETLYLLEEPEIRQLVWSLAGLQDDERSTALEIIEELRSKRHGRPIV